MLNEKKLETVTPVATGDNKDLNLGEVVGMKRIEIDPSVHLANM